MAHCIRSCPGYWIWFPDMKMRLWQTVTVICTATVLVWRHRTKRGEALQSVFVARPPSYRCYTATYVAVRRLLDRHKKPDTGSGSVSGFTPTNHAAIPTTNHRSTPALTGLVQEAVDWWEEWVAPVGEFCTDIAVTRWQDTRRLPLVTNNVQPAGHNRTRMKRKYEVSCAGSIQKACHDL